MIGELIHLAKRLKDTEGIINISTITPSVLLREDKFDELFPKWTDTTTYTNDDGESVQIRSIILDGVMFECVARLDGE